MTKKTFVALLGTGIMSLSLVACSPSNENDSTASQENTTMRVAASSTSTKTSAASADSSTAEDAQVVDGLSLSKAYVKAKAEDSTMTAIFGVLTNTTDQPMHIVGFTTSLNAPVNQIHEVVNGTMREREGGILLNAGETLELKPGADHFMLMDLSGSVQAGDTITLTINLDDGSEMTFTDIPVRTISSGQESYGADGGVEGNSGMDSMGDMEGMGDMSTMDHSSMTTSASSSATSGK